MSYRVQTKNHVKLAVGELLWESLRTKGRRLFARENDQVYIPIGPAGKDEV
jgi:hypothetical protein